jgi:hypothetical protein
VDNNIQDIPDIELLRDGVSELGDKYYHRCRVCEEQEFLLVLFGDAGGLCENCLKEGMNLIEKEKEAIK